MVNGVNLSLTITIEMHIAQEYLLLK